jgi:hypothetical protein
MPAYEKMPDLPATCRRKFSKRHTLAFWFRERSSMARKSEVSTSCMVRPVSSLWTSFPDGSKEYLNKRWYEYTGLPLEAARLQTVIEGVGPGHRGEIPLAQPRGGATAAYTVGSTYVGDLSVMCRALLFGGMPCLRTLKIARLQKERSGNKKQSSVR